MKVSAVIALVEPLELDSEVKQKIMSLISGIGDGDEVPSDIKNQIIELLDLEIETNELLAESYDEMTQEIDQYHANLGQAIANKNNNL